MIQERVTALHLDYRLRFTGAKHRVVDPGWIFSRVVADSLGSLMVGHKRASPGLSLWIISRSKKTGISTKAVQMTSGGINDLEWRRDQ